MIPAGTAGTAYTAGKAVTQVNKRIWLGSGGYILLCPQGGKPWLHSIKQGTEAILPQAGEKE